MWSYSHRGVLGTCNLIIVESIEPRVTNDMNETLLQPYTSREIKKALKQMHPAKAPRPDIMPPLFFQCFWPVTHEYLVDTYLNILNHGADFENLNHTYIVLIPKLKLPENPRVPTH